MLETLAIDSWRILIGFLSLLPILYWYLTKNYNYWSNQGISGPKPILLFGTILERMRSSVAHLDVGYFKKFGTVYGIFDGTSPVLEIGDPELIKLVLVKEFHRFINRRDLKTYHPIVNTNLFNARSEDWKRIRSIAGSTFTSGKMKKLYGLVRKCLQEYLEHLEEVSQSGQPCNVKEMHENLTMDVIASCAFATQTNSIKDPNNPFIVNGRKIFKFKTIRMIPGFIFPKFLNKLLNIQTIADPEANEWICNLAKHIIEKRRQTGEKNNDFLQLLMDAKIDDSKRGDTSDGLESHYINNDEDEITNEKKNYKNKSLTENEIIGQCWVFLLAGFETTATTLGYLSRELALNPDCQEKLHKEVVTAMGSEKEISYEDLHRLPYLDACISETLRVYPPVVRLEREVDQDFKLGDSEIKLYKGQLVEIPVYAIHHSEHYYKNAEKFIPDRFLSENRNQLIPYTYMPFGTGPRNCIGMRFALMEIKLAMAHIIMRYRFTKCDKTEEKLEFRPGTPILAALNVVVGIEKR